MRNEGVDDLIHLGFLEAWLEVIFLIFRNILRRNLGGCRVMTATTIEQQNTLWPNKRPCRKELTQNRFQLGDAFVDIQICFGDEKLWEKGPVWLGNEKYKNRRRLIWKLRAVFSPKLMVYECEIDSIVAIGQRQDSMARRMGFLQSPRGSFPAGVKRKRVVIQVWDRRLEETNFFASGAFDKSRMHRSWNKIGRNRCCQLEKG